jgi:hypothetical protein
VKANAISNMLEILALVAIVIAAIIVDQWIKRRSDQGQKEELLKRGDHDPDAA